MAETKDSEERRNEFVEAAEKLFREHGIVDTTINSIVKEMNVAKGLFYYYFKSKDDVIDAISEKYNELFNEMMNASMDALREAQRAFAGEAERLGLKDDDNVMAMIKEMREESVVK